MAERPLHPESELEPRFKLKLDLRHDPLVARPSKSPVPEVSYLGHRQQAVVEVAPPSEYDLIAVSPLHMDPEERLSKGDRTHQRALSGVVCPDEDAEVLRLDRRRSETQNV